MTRGVLATDCSRQSTDSYTIIQKLRDGSLPYKPCYKFYCHIKEMVGSGKKVRLSDVEKQVFYFVHRSLTTTYFIKAPICKRVKIGRSMNVKRRLAALNQQCPEMLHILATIQYDYDLEQRVHKYMAAHREHGEWFKDGAHINDFIDGWRSGGADWLVGEVGDAGSFWMNSPDRNRIGLGIYKDLCINC